jgi:hypothetical protein
MNDPKISRAARALSKLAHAEPRVVTAARIEASRRNLEAGRAARWTPERRRAHSITMRRKHALRRGEKIPGVIGWSKP